MLKQPQQGINQLANLLHYNVIRLHYLEGLEAGKSKSYLVDRFELAVSERNIRMIYLHTTPTKDADHGIIKDNIDNLADSLQGNDGVVQTIRDSGFTIGTAKSFHYVHHSFEKYMKLILLLSASALAALLAGYFIPLWRFGVFIASLLGFAFLYKVSSSLSLEAAALVAGISAPTLSVIFAIQNLHARRERKLSTVQKTVHALLLFIRTLLMTSMGILLIIGLLDNITYFLYFQQFRGLQVLFLVPIALIAMYVLFFFETESFTEVLHKVKAFLQVKISLLMVVLSVLGAAAMWYYLTRTGNSGHAFAFEKAARTFLANSMGVRPRTKEFLIAHPIFILGAYLSLRYRNARYIMIIGVMGQLSIADTFAHLHTPVLISMIRTLYGAVLGGIIGLIAIAGWEIAARGWKKWQTIEK
ncbi:MAG: hypothetical protein A2189_04455 [Paenibacillus sp. RIFOXYA1_FULL_44_5]|nr:MAG: hypothetical protein A2189_04455 [Paenibacillus sp. RIFOXYA1_FULL_44_5]